MIYMTIRFSDGGKTWMQTGIRRFRIKGGQMLIARHPTQIAEEVLAYQDVIGNWVTPENGHRWTEWQISESSRDVTPPQLTTNTQEKL
jgi:hypothetical protein